MLSVSRSIIASKSAPILVFQRMRRALVGRAAAGNHVGCHSPGCARKTDQRGFFAAVRDARCEWSRRSGSECRGSSSPDPSLSDSGCVVIVDRRGPSPVTNHKSAPSACGSSKMSANRIAASMPYRRIGLKRCFGSQRRRPRKSPACARRRLVFRQIPPCLPHHPDRRGRKGFARKGAAGWSWSGSSCLSLSVAFRIDLTDGNMSRQAWLSGQVYAPKEGLMTH